jgi:hypothetical protein
MIRSMTAFGRARKAVDGKDITVEIKSVNNRFFDCSAKLPRAFSFLEEKIKPYLQAHSIARGKVDVFVSIEVLDDPEININIDEGYAKQYIAALRALRDRFDLPDDISVMKVAENREIFTVVKTDFTESEPAGKIRILSKDTMAPILYHTPVYTAYEGNNIVINATAKDITRTGCAFMNFFIRSKFSSPILFHLCNPQYLRYLKIAFLCLRIQAFHLKNLRNLQEIFCITLRIAATAQAVHAESLA